MVSRLSSNALLPWILNLVPALLLAREIANLRREAQAFKSVRAALRSRDTSSSAAKMAFQKVVTFTTVWNINLIT
jgi:hypothetical protein